MEDSGCRWQNEEEVLLGTRRKQFQLSKIRFELFVALFRVNRTLFPGLQHLIRENCDQEEISAMRESLVHEGWERGDFLPEDWMIRKSEGTTNGIKDAPEKVESNIDVG